MAARELGCDDRLDWRQGILSDAFPGQARQANMEKAIASSGCDASRACRASRRSTTRNTQTVNEQATRGRVANKSVGHSMQNKPQISSYMLVSHRLFVLSWPSYSKEVRREHGFDIYRVSRMLSKIRLGNRALKDCLGAKGPPHNESKHLQSV